MKGIHDFIIKVSHVYNQTFKTERGIELHADSRFNPERLANRIAVVQEVPLSLKGKTEIQVGDLVMIDPTVFYGGEYEATGKQLSPFAIDVNKGLYKIKDDMIVLFRKNEQYNWKANRDNLLVEFKKQNIEEKKQGLIITDIPKTRISQTECKAFFVNKEIEEEGVSENDDLIIQSGYGVSFWIEGKELSWIKNRHVLVKVA